MGRTLILTSPLEKGDDVKAFQRELIHHGYLNGTVDGVYGKLTAQGVYRAKYWLGYVKPDHNAGDLLYGYLTGKKPTVTMRLLAAKRKKAKPAPTETIGAKALKEAFKYVGVSESPSGSNHTKFGVWYGADRVAWCNIFVTFCHIAVGSKAFERGHRYAFVPYMAADAHRGINGLSIANPVRPGDTIAFTWPGEPGGPHHTGFFVKWINQSAGTFETLEGNTSLGNNSNGGQVQHRKDRNLGEVHTFIRVSK